MGACGAVVLTQHSEAGNGEVEDNRQMGRLGNCWEVPMFYMDLVHVEQVHGDLVDTT